MKKIIKKEIGKVKERYRIIWLFLISLFILLSVVLYSLGYYKGSLIDDTKNKEITAKIVCYNQELGMTLTWEFEKLNTTELLNAKKYAEENNCTFNLICIFDENGKEVCSLE